MRLLFSFMAGVVNGLTSETSQKSTNSLAEQADSVAEKAEKDYKAGKISLKQYLAIINKTSKSNK